MAAGVTVQAEVESLIYGNPDGDVTVVKFSDYRCPHCRTAHSAVDALILSDPMVKVIRRELPVLGHESVMMARFAVASLGILGSAKTVAVTDDLFTWMGAFTESSVIELSEKHGMDLQAVLAAMRSDHTMQVIANTADMASLLGMTGTPVFVIGNQMIPGVIPSDELIAIVAKLRTEAPVK